jgi:hypothetical protein
MPQQAIFLDEQIGDKHITVLKSYDRQFAREVFDAMDEAARADLVRALHLEDEHEAAELASLDLIAEVDLLWDELVDQAREDSSLFSFFVVTEATGKKSDSLFVSPDWPSAEAFATDRLNLARQEQ